MSPEAGASDTFWVLQGKTPLASDTEIFGRNCITDRLQLGVWAVLTTIRRYWSYGRPARAMLRNETTKSAALLVGLRVWEACG